MTSNRPKAQGKCTTRPDLTGSLLRIVRPHCARDVGGGIARGLSLRRQVMAGGQQRNSPSLCVAWPKGSSCRERTKKGEMQRLLRRQREHGLASKRSVRTKRAGLQLRPPRCLSGKAALPRHEQKRGVARWPKGLAARSRVYSAWGLTVELSGARAGV
jgi:hypothetical protein